VIADECVETSDPQAHSRKPFDAAFPAMERARNDGGTMIAARQRTFPDMP
jgi:hypothetical protein